MGKGEEEALDLGGALRGEGTVEHLCPFAAPGAPPGSQHRRQQQALRVTAGRQIGVGRAGVSHDRM